MKNIKLYKSLEEFISSNQSSKKEYYLLVAENCEFDYKKLKETNISFYGAIVTQVIFNDSNYDNGLIACELEDEKINLIEDLENPELKEKDYKDANSLMVLLDGLSSNISTFLDSLFNVLPLNVEILGGGAGKLTLKQEPVIFSNKGIYENAALTISKKSKLFIGVENGWEFLEGPFMVTSSNKNILKSLNFMDAFEVYKSVVEEDSGLKFNNAFETYKNVVEKESGKQITEDNFFDIAKSYPLGIVKFNKEIIVRDPIAKDEKGNMILVGDLEQNSTINILKGNKKSLIASSNNAIKKALESNTEKLEIKNVVLFDCISRCIFLENDFKKELNEIKKQVNDETLFGALTLGEIANNGNEYINFYNKTCVVGVLC
ncbi:FIST signal transduction protein [Arcobacter arenosus]|jgi:hypothetical protein|uniref:FIST signal transduction protein n=1 Tax=Arcobacter arenosus TaxID=2576037 RepID=UPI003BA9AB33